MILARGVNVKSRGPSYLPIMEHVSLLRLYLLRAIYLIIAVGEGSIIWPQILHQPPAQHGVAQALLGALTLLALLGVRYPLKMLPLLFFEMTWKAIWLLSVAWPLWAANQLNGPLLETAHACLLGMIVPLLLPWPYVFATFLKAPDDRWR